MADPRALFERLPAWIQRRDQAQGGPLAQLLAAIDAELQRMEGAIEQRHLNSFLETCDEETLPFIADLVGLRLAEHAGPIPWSRRAQVAHAVDARRRKGTPGAIEQAARAASGWPARVLEHPRHVTLLPRLDQDTLVARLPTLANIRDGEAMSKVGGPFDPAVHLPDLRLPGQDQARYGLDRIGVSVWRQRSAFVDRARAFPAPGAPGCFTFDALGRDQRLFIRPESLSVSDARVAPRHVPSPLSAEALSRQLSEAPPTAEAAGAYGPARSLALTRVDDDAQRIPPSKVVVANLSDWTRPPAGRVAVDPERGRVAFPEAEAPRALLTRYAWALGADIGGGPYPRGSALASAVVPSYAGPRPRGARDGAFSLLLSDALEDAWAVVEPLGLGVIEHLSQNPWGGEVRLERRGVGRYLLRFEGAPDDAGLARVTPMGLPAATARALSWGPAGVVVALDGADGLPVDAAFSLLWARRAAERCWSRVHAPTAEAPAVTGAHGVDRVERLGTGMYRVWLSSRVTGARFCPLACPTGEAPHLAWVKTWAADYVVVWTTDMDGEAADHPFAVLVERSGDATWVWSQDNQVSQPYSQSPRGPTPALERLAEGRYRVRLEGRGRTNATVQAANYGPSASLPSVDAWSGDAASLTLHAADGAPAPSRPSEPHVGVEDDDLEGLLSAVRCGAERIRLDHHGLIGDGQALHIHPAPGHRALAIVAGEGWRPAIHGDLILEGLPAGFRLTLDGVALRGRIRLRDALHLELRDCTLYDPEGGPTLVFEGDAAADLRVRAKRCRMGALRIPDEAARLELEDCVIQADAEGWSVGRPVRAANLPRVPGLTDPMPPDAPTRFALSGLDPLGQGPPARLLRCTVLGELRLRALLEAEDCLFLAPVTVLDPEQGVVRTSYIRSEHRLPPLDRCQPDLLLAQEAPDVNAPILYTDAQRLTDGNPDWMLRAGRGGSAPGITETHEAAWARSVAAIPSADAVGLTENRVMALAALGGGGAWVLADQPDLRRYEADSGPTVNPWGAAPVVLRDYIGRYRVYVPGRPAGSCPLVLTWGPTEAVARVHSWAGELITVHVTRPDGVPVDAPFLLRLTDPDADAWALADAPTETEYSPAAAYDPTRSVQIRRAAPGQYRVTFTDRPVDGHALLLCPYGPAPCLVGLAGWDAASVEVHTFDPTGAPMDAPFLLAVCTSAEDGWAWADTPGVERYAATASFVPAALISVERAGTGQLTWGHPHQRPGAVHATPFQAETPCAVRVKQRTQNQVTTESEAHGLPPVVSSPVDARTTVFADLRGRSASLLADQPSEGRYTPTEATSPWGTMEVERTGIGRYTVHLSAPAGACPLVTAWGETEAMARVLAFSESAVQVALDRPDGAPIDAAFSFLMVSPDLGMWALADQPEESSYTPTEQLCSSGAVTVTRASPGVYVVQFEGQSFGAGNVQLIPYGATASLVTNFGWGNGRVNVRTFDVAGQPADMPFLIVAVTDTEDAWAWTHQPESASYAPSGGYANNPEGPIVAGRSATGIYSVQLQGASLKGAQLSPYHTGSGTQACSPRILRREDDTLHAVMQGPVTSPQVRLFESSGLADTRGTYFADLLGRNASLLADQPTQRRYSPSTARSPWGAMEVERTSAGRYTVHLSARAGACPLVTAWGEVEAMARIVAFSETAVQVATDTLDGTPIDAAFSFLMVSPDLGQWAVADQPGESSYAPEAQHCSTGAATVTRRERGVYVVRFEGQRHLVANVRIVPYGAQASLATLREWGSELVEVRTFDVRGRPADASFLVLVITDRGDAWAWMDQAEDDAYSPRSTYANNPAGPIVARRSATGEYSVELSGPALNGAQVSSCHAGGGQGQPCSPRVVRRDDATVHVVMQGPLVWLEQTSYESEPVDTRTTVFADLQGRSASLIADQPGQSRYTPAEATSPWGAVEVERTDRGRYTVHLSAPAGACPLVTAWGEVEAMARVVTFSGSAVHVAMDAPDGAPVDAAFSFLMVSPDVGMWAVADQPEEGSYTPAQQRCSTGAVTVTRDAVGEYSVQFGGQSFGAGDVQVVPYGADPSLVIVYSWGDGRVNVRAYDLYGQPADAPFLILAVTDPADAWAWTDQATSASYAPSATYANNPMGQIHAARSATGAYSVTFEGPNLYGAQLSPYRAGIGQELPSSPRIVRREDGAVHAVMQGPLVYAQPETYTSALVDTRTTVLADLQGRSASLLADEPRRSRYTPAEATSPWGAMEVERTGVGRYTVHLSAPSGACPLVTAWGEVEAMARVVAFTEGAVQVATERLNGAPVDAAFSLLMVSPDVGMWALADQPTEGSYTPSTQRCSSGAITVTRSALGVYVVQFGGQSFGSGAVQLVPYGATASLVVNHGWGGGRVTVRTHDVYGELVDAPFLILALTDRADAWAWTDQATGASYTPNSGWANNPAGAIVAGQSATGTYSVQFQGASLKGAQLSPYRWSGDGPPCSARIVRRDGDTLHAVLQGPVSSVQAAVVGKTGPVDTRTTFLADLQRRSASLIADQPALGRYTPATAAGPWGAMEVERTGVGRYTVHLSAPAGACPLVTAWGEVEAMARVVSFTQSAVQVATDTLEGAPVDAAFSFLMVSPAVGMWAVADAAGADSYTPAAQRCSTGAVTVTRSGLGVYVVEFPGQSFGAGNVQLVPYGPSPSLVVNYGWGSGRVNVRTCDLFGEPVDAPFLILALTDAADAWAWTEQPTSASYAPSAAYANNPLGAIVASRSAAGTYCLAFDLPSLKGAQLSPYRGATQDQPCSPRIIRREDRTLHAVLQGPLTPVQTREARSSGPVDAPATFFADLRGYSASVLADRPSEGRYSPTPLSGKASHAMEVERTGVGRYTVRHHAVDGTCPLVTVWGEVEALARVVSFTERTAHIATDALDGTPVDAAFSLLLFNPGVVGMWAVADQPEVTRYAPSAQRCSSGAVTVTRDDLGVYVVQFEGQTLDTACVQVAPYGADAALVAVHSWGSAGVKVHTYDLFGQPADAPFLLLAVTDTGEAWAWLDQPESASYTPSPSGSNNPVGPIVAERSATGVYSVSFQGPSPAGVQLSAYSGGDAQGHPSPYPPSSPRIVRQDGLAVHWVAQGPVTPVALDPQGPAHSGASALIVAGDRVGVAKPIWPLTNPRRLSTAPSQNPWGTPPVAKDLGGGRYEVIFHGAPADACPLVSVEGDTPALAQVSAFSGERVQLLTMDMEGGELAVAWQLSLFPPGLASWALADQPGDEAYSPSRANNAEGAVEITRSDVGVYQVRFIGQDLNDANVQLVAYGDEPALLSLEGWSTDAVEVRCYSVIGVPADRAFLVLATRDAAQSWSLVSNPSGRPLSVDASRCHTAPPPAEVTRAAAGSYQLSFPNTAPTAGFLTPQGPGSPRLMGIRGEVLDALVQAPAEALGEHVVVLTALGGVALQDAMTHGVERLQLSFDGASPHPETLQLRPGVMRVEASAGSAPTLGDLDLRAPSEGATLTIEGLRVTGDLKLSGPLQLRLEHCEVDGAITQDGEVQLSATRCRLGPVRGGPALRLRLVDCLVEGRGGASLGDRERRPTLLLAERCTLRGPSWIEALELAVDSVFDGSVFVRDRSSGLLQRCFLPEHASRTPSRDACVPERVFERLLARHRPLLTADPLSPAWAQLAPEASPTLRRGASDGGAMGAFNRERHAAREDALREAISEHLPAGFTADVIFET